MGLVSLLFSFKGRINRAQYWLGSLGVGFGGALVFVMIGFSAMPQPGMSKEATLQAAPMLLLAMGIVGLVMGWCGLALQVKRFHDRNQPGWFSLLPVLPMMGLMVTLVGGVVSGYSPQQLGASLQPYMLGLWAINFFFFINLGCLGSHDGPNKYGDPPGSSPSSRVDPSPSSRPQAQPQAAFSLGGVEAAMERAIAEKARATPAPAKPAPRPAIASAMPATAGAPASFGRRPTR